MTDKPIPPLDYQWDGEALKPLRPKMADAYLVVGQTYRMAEHHDRSSQSHNHYFACVQSAWQNLPEKLADRFPTAEHLRQWALIKCGYREETHYACNSDDEAAFLAKVIRQHSEYAVITISEGSLSVYKAQSQSNRAMDKERFQKSKQDVLDLLASMIGVTSEELGKNAT